MKCIVIKKTKVYTNLYIICKKKKKIYSMNIKLFKS